MKCYYPTDKSGNRIGFKTPEACIYDTSGTNLTNKLNKLRTDVNGKAAASHGNHVPAPQTANNKVYLRNDNTWHTITPSDIGAAASSHSHSWDSITGKPSTYTPSSHTHTISQITNLQSTLDGKAAASHGTHVPTPQTANNKIYLRNDNTWHTITPSDIGAAASSHSHSWDSITSKPSLYTTSQIDSKVDAINSNISTRTEGTIWIGDRMHIDERKYAYGYVDSGNANRVMRSKYDIYFYGIKNLNITNLSTRSELVFTYCGDKSYVGDGAMSFNIPYKYLTPSSILSITGFIVAVSADGNNAGYYPLPYFEPEDNPGSGIDIHSISIHNNPSKTGSAITIAVQKHTHTGTWQSNENRSYYFYFKVESSGYQ